MLRTSSATRSAAITGPACSGSVSARPIHSCTVLGSGLARCPIPATTAFVLAVVTAAPALDTAGDPLAPVAGARRVAIVVNAVGGVEDEDQGAEKGT